ncbi:helitron_like_N domain-containing protein [Trichonephila clavata]|uniref:Helitron_like_N domain-containing protein n=1 Tax=Trichonephila clavata TaxID=2740835 RepID=A0A8X6H920_TRICU|nr:helitron_like_N domain-containing protein [Trichonephila clavata]
MKSSQQKCQTLKLIKTCTILSQKMIHGPCGSLNNNSLCVSDGKCTKKYPRDLLAETITDNDGYPLYRRRSTEDG